MDDERASLASEAEAVRRQLQVSEIGSDAAQRVAAARARFLPYVIVGGAPFALVAALVVAGAAGTEDETQGPMVAGLTAGIVVGMTVGWLSLQVLERIVWRRSPGRLQLDAAIVATTIPGFVVGGWTAALGALVVASMEAGSSSAVSIPNIWPILVVSAAVIYPISYVFARRDLNRPTNLVDAISAALDEPDQPAGDYSILARALVAVVLLVGTGIAMLAVLAALQSVAPDRYADASSRYTVLFVVAGLAGWIGLTVGLTGLTMRLLRRVMGP